MCIKPLLPGQVLKDIILIYKPSLEETLGRPIGLMLIGCGMFPGEVNLGHVSGWGGKGCLGKGCSESREMYVLLVGASEEGELNLSWMQMFPSPFMPLSFILISFSFKGIVRGHCPGVVTSGGNVTHKHFTEMRMLAHDETPFLLAMPPRATTLAW
jgi:hypothetical protein